MSQPLIQIVDLCKSFSGQKVLNGANLSIYKGEITTIIGKSGGGKSVLLKHIIGLLEPDSGQVLFDGMPISSMNKAQKKAWRSKISYVFQNAALFDSLTVFDNIAMPLVETRRVSKEEVAAAVEKRLAQLDIGAIGNKYPSQISGGMQKRVSLARALITAPEVVLFDEPTTGLDPIRKSAVLSMVSSYQRRLGFTGVMVSHEIPDIFFISQRVAMLDKGKVVFEGPPEDLQRSDKPVIIEFLQGLEQPRDALTGMGTQQQLSKSYEAESDRSARTAQAFCLVVFSLDNLEEITEQSTHVMAQTVMANFAAELGRHLRVFDSCARYGFDRILVVMPNTGMNEAKKLIERISRSLQRKNVVPIAPYPDFCLMVSAGFAQAGADESIEAVLERAANDEKNVYTFKVC
ncbi:MAG: ATP-binding cassette domain-containing protein [Desulfatibacillaceae bacterium]|nr:ATP-binding cassette domain-containing protein [Desulfatibacillaceae bacterium]